MKPDWDNAGFPRGEQGRPDYQQQHFRRDELFRDWTIPYERYDCSAKHRGWRLGATEKDSAKLWAGGLGTGRTIGRCETRRWDNGFGVKGWISKNGMKVLSGGVKIGAAVGQSVLTPYLKQHFGLDQ